MKNFLLLLNRRGPFYSKKALFGVCAQTPKFYAQGQRGSGFSTTLEFREIRPFLAFFGHFRGFRKNREKVYHITFDSDFYETCTVCVKHKIEKQDTSGVCTPECVTVCTVCTSRRLRARGRVTVQMSHLEQQFIWFLINNIIF
jgi:hypothetical protein